MLAKLASTIPTGDSWIYEPKWDGFRALVFKDGDEITIQSRDKERPHPASFPPIVINVTGARHTWAVRAIRNGASLEVIRRQLGHVNTHMANLVYAPFQPNEEEMTTWHDRAEEHDRKNGTD